MIVGSRVKVKQDILHTNEKRKPVVTKEGSIGEVIHIYDGVVDLVEITLDADKPYSLILLKKDLELIND